MGYCLGFGEAQIRVSLRAVADIKMGIKAAINTLRMFDLPCRWFFELFSIAIHVTCTILMPAILKV